MTGYDPAVGPEPSEWLALDEQERIERVDRFHQRARIKMPNATLHAAFHAVVENQLAMVDSRVQATMERLLREGLARHDAIHAIGSVLAGRIWGGLQGQVTDEALPDCYYHDLEALSASRWRGTL